MLSPGPKRLNGGPITIAMGCGPSHPGPVGVRVDPALGPRGQARVGGRGVSHGFPACTSMFHV